MEVVRDQHRLKTAWMDCKDWMLHYLGLLSLQIPSILSCFHKTKLSKMAWTMLITEHRLGSVSHMHVPPSISWQLKAWTCFRELFCVEGGTGRSKPSVCHVSSFILATSCCHQMRRMNSIPGFRAHKCLLRSKFHRVHNRVYITPPTFSGLVCILVKVPP